MHENNCVRNAIFKKLPFLMNLLTWAPCTQDEKVILWGFSSVFHRFWPCEHMHKCEFAS